MIFLVHAPFSTDSISGGIGVADYSYYFVLRAYLPVLETLGTVVELSDPLREAPEHHRRALAAGEYCVLLFFAPPQRIPLRLECPVVPVIAWEYDTLPNESWSDDQETNWALILATLGRAITHSEFAAQVIRRAIRPDYPVVSVPAPLWDRFAALPQTRRAPLARRSLAVDGTVLDSREADLTRPVAGLLESFPPGRREIVLDGVVYTAVFCPLDGRKNWEDMLTAFCWAFRDAADCTLLLKLVHHDRHKVFEEVLAKMRRLPPCAARVVFVHAFLDDGQYADLVRAADYVVNSSLGEGQCLPLMEHMSAGVPAIAPAHTSMLDYLDESCGFPVRSWRESCHWPHDLRVLKRTHRSRPDWESLRDAYRASRELRVTAPEAYERMGTNARESLRRFCSREVARERLQRFFEAHAAALEASARELACARQTQGTPR